MAILLIGIRDLGDSVYELQMMDNGTPVNFTFHYQPKYHSVRGNREFDRHFAGRTSGRDAVGALGKFVTGEPLTFPITVREDGYSGRF